MFIVQYYVSDENSWERPITISSIVHNPQSAVIQIEAHIKKVFPSSKYILIGMEKVNGDDDVKNMEIEFDKRVDEIGHKEIVSITNRLRKGLITLPDDKPEDPRSVYCQLYFNQRNYYVMCPIDLYKAIRNTFLDYYYKDNLGEGIHKMKEYDDSMKYIDRGLYVRLCNEDEMTIQTKIKVQDILMSWDGKVRDEDVDYIEVLIDNFTKYSSFKLESL